MRVLIAFDKFKDALRAEEACAVGAEVLREVHPEWALDVCPLTDGGEGFARVLTGAVQGESRAVLVSGPRRNMRVAATFGLVEAARIPVPARRLLGRTDVPDRAKVGIAELATASGLELLAPELRNPWFTTTVGTGELLAAAAHAGADLILLGVGGSATNDLALGALAALGWRFLADDGTAIDWPAPETWDRLAAVTGGPAAALPPVRIACDVTNPLLGPAGCTSVFAPQKGLPPGDQPRLEAVTAQVAQLLCRHFQKSYELAATPGAGAAGGTPFGLRAALDASVVPGSELVAAWLALDERIRAADLVLTGEGSYDATSLAGKGAGAVVQRATALGRPVLVFAGRVAPELRHQTGVHAITPPECPLPEALARTPALLGRAIRRHAGTAFRGGS
jgi:glycerate kinase